VTSPVAGLVETTFPRNLYTLKDGAAELCVSGFGLEWHPATTATAKRAQASRDRIVSSVQLVD
jgi:hypothetical protein